MPDGRLLVSVGAAPDPTCAGSGGLEACQTVRRPDGTVVRTQVVRGDRQVRAVVTVEKPDGTMLRLAGESDVGQAYLPLAFPPLTRIGLAPGLTVNR